MNDREATDTARRRVREQYEAAVTPQTRTGGVLCDCAGYDPDELAGCPNAAVSSFACGNPLAECDVKPGQVVLDLGSGAGLDLLLAARRVGPAGRVIGVDMTEAMIDTARRNVAGHANVELRKGIIEDLPVDTGSVDWVISNCVITLSPQKQRVFDEIFRVLRPAGRMVVSDLVVDGLGALAVELPWVTRTCLGTALTEAQYLAGLERAGLVEPRILGRVTYDTPRIVELLQSERAPGDRTLESTVMRALVQRTCAGAVHSVRISAGKGSVEPPSH